MDFFFIVLSTLFGYYLESVNGYVYNLGDEYGIEWIFFPDGDGYPHFVNLTYEEKPDIDLKMRSSYENEITYRLYTRQNRDEYELLSNSGDVINEICENGCFVNNVPVKVVTHGWMSDADKSSVILIKDAYLKKHDVNIIALDWSSISISYMYPKVALETLKVGKEVAKFLNALIAKYHVHEDQVHLIGHSLGAHVMGNAAYYSNLNVSRITGLDPARPMFEYPWRDNSVRLDPGDAQFVDVIHTCAGVLGVKESFGHADFYPNDGMAPQPGCQGIQPLLEACSHGRAHAYFAEAIEVPHSFPAYQCGSWNQYLMGKCTKENVFMGENVDRNLRGDFYLATNAHEPFGIGFTQEKPEFTIPK